MGCYVRAAVCYCCAVLCYCQDTAERNCCCLPNSSCRLWGSGGVAPLYGSDNYVRLEEEVEEVEAVYGHAYGNGDACAGACMRGKQL